MNGNVILVPLDGSAFAGSALPYAVVLRGPAAETLEDYIRQHQIDLTIVVSTWESSMMRKRS
jgi:hypothetical protein